MRVFLLFTSFLLFFSCMVKQGRAQGNQTIPNGVPTAPINFPGTGCTYFWTNNNPGIGLPASSAGNIPSFIPVNNGSTPVTATITATPEPTGYAYIANYGDGTISIINTATNTIVNTITKRSDVIGVGVDNNLERFLISNSGANSINIINTIQQSFVTEPDSIVHVGSTPWGIVETPDAKTYYVANSGSNTVSVINALTLAVEPNITVGTSPKGLALSADGKTLYVTNSGSSSVSVISTANNTKLTSIPLNAAPLGIVTSPDGNLVYVTTAGSPGAVVAISTATNTIVNTIPVGNNPSEVAVTQNSGIIYVTNSGSNTVSVINTANDAVIKTIDVGTYPFGISITPDGSHVYVTNENSNNVSVISTLTNAVTGLISVGKQPTSFGNFIVGSGTGCSSFPVTVSITVTPGVPPPLIIADAATGTIQACIGNASASPDVQQFTVSGTNLTGPITATSPAGFEVSLSPSGGYGGSVSIASTGNAVNTATVYVQSAASAPLGTLTGNVTLSTPGGNNKQVAVTGTINPLPTINNVNNVAVTGSSATQAIKFTGTGNGFNWTNNTPGIGLPANGTGNIAPFTAMNNTGSAIVATVTVTPSYSNFAYIANFSDGTLSVINVAGNALLTTVPLVSGNTKPYAVAVSPDGNTVYVTDEYANTVLVVDATTNVVLIPIPVGMAPSGLAIGPDGKILYVVNSYSNDVWAINTSTNATIFDQKVGKNPQAIALSSDGTTLYVTNSISGTVSVINTGNGSITANVSVGSTPSGIAVSADGKMVYVANAGSNTISVINAATYQVSATIPVGKNPQGVAISPEGGILFVTNNVSNTVSVINTSGNTVTTSVPVGGSPFGISITPDGSAVYVSNAGTNNVSVISTATDKVINTIPVGSQPDSFGNFITANRSGCTGAPITFTITVAPAPVTAAISTTGTPSPLSTIYGTPSTSTVFTVSGIKLNGGILITPPTGFEVSTDEVTFSKTITVGATGNVATTTVYIRLAATTPVENDYGGKITLTSAGATDVTVEMPTSIVIPADLTVTADNKSKTFGQPNPRLTASYTGFVNNETASVLSVLPVLTTTAVTTSPAGQYPITADGASALNYTVVNYVDGTLTVLPAPQAIIIPNAFTPNADGVNDTWDIKFIDTYTNCTVDVFNRWGQKVYSSIGYAVPWDGACKGKVLPSGTYYYIINLKNGSDPLSGFVAIIR